MSLPSLSFIRDFGENTILIYLRKIKIFLPVIHILLTNKIFIYFHTFSKRDDFKEKHNNIDFALTMEVIFLYLLQLYYVFLRICWWLEITTSSSCAAMPSSVLFCSQFPSLMTLCILLDDMVTKYNGLCLEGTVSSDLWISFAGVASHQKLPLEGEKSQFRYNFQGHYNWHVP